MPMKWRTCNTWGRIREEEGGDFEAFYMGNHREYTCDAFAAGKSSNSPLQVASTCVYLFTCRALFDCTAVYRLMQQSTALYVRPRQQLSTVARFAHGNLRMIILAFPANLESENEESLSWLLHGLLSR